MSLSEKQFLLTYCSTYTNVQLQVSDISHHSNTQGLVKVNSVTKNLSNAFENWVEETRNIYKTQIN